jgi:HSP20 family protein
LANRIRTEGEQQVEKMITVASKPGQRRPIQGAENPDFVIVNWRVSSHPHMWRPPTDVFEFEDSVIVRVEIAGMKEEDFLIQLEQNVLVIRGVRQEINERRAYHQMEINFGEFLTAVELQIPFDTQSVSAEYQNGFLRIRLPKAQPKIIKVKE